MARYIRHDRNRPYVIQVGEKTISLCACGLSKNKPYCDGTHKILLDEQADEVYAYDERYNRIKVKLLGENNNPISISSQYPDE